MPEESNEKPTITLANLDPPDTGFTPDVGADIRHSLPDDIGKHEVKIEDFKSIINSKDPNANDKKDKQSKGADNGKNLDQKGTTEADKEAQETEEGKQDKPKEDVKGTKEVPDIKPEIPAISQVDDDTTKYGEEATKFFPKMDKTAREYLKARLSELGEIKGKLRSSEERLTKQVGNLPSNYLDHPEAYKLDPKYNEAVANIQNLQNEMEIWTNALVACRAGDKWQKPTGRDANGNILFQEMEASPKADVELSSILAHGRQMLYGNQQIIENLSSQFKAGHERQKKDFQDLAAYYFPNYIGDKGKDNKFIKAMSAILEEKGQKDNIVSPFVNYLYALVMEQAGYIQTNEAKWKEKDKPLVVKQPNSGDINNAGGDKKVGIEHKPFDIADFQKEMA